MKSKAWHRQQALGGVTAEIAHILLAGTGINHDVMFPRLPGFSYLLVAFPQPGSMTFSQNV